MFSAAKSRRRRLLPALFAIGLAACGPSFDGEKNRVEAKQFMEANKQKAGVVTTASGLQYEVIREGAGEPPKATDTVTVNYKGGFPDGSTFDAGDGVSFPLNGVIPGWTEGLQLMKPGAKYRFFIPPELGYGEYGAGRVIPPNAALIFEVELLKVGG
jgi:FKBP-type peptidyl-prolyl cis-trans isomerase